MVENLCESCGAEMWFEEGEPTSKVCYSCKWIAEREAELFDSYEDEVTSED